MPTNEELANTAIRAKELLDDIHQRAHDMHQLYRRRDSYPLATTPEGRQWWDRHDAEVEAEVKELKKPYDEKAAELCAITDELLDAAELPGVRGEPLNLSLLANIAQIFRSFTPRAGLLPNVFDFMQIRDEQLDRLARRLRLGESTVRRAPSISPATPQASGAPEWSMIEREHGASRLSHTDLAAKCGVDPDALRKRLARWRRDNKSEAGSGWVEVTDAKSTDPRSLYLVRSVLHVARDLWEKASGASSGKRPAPKNPPAKSPKKSG